MAGQKRRNNTTTRQPAKRARARHGGTQTTPKEDGAPLISLDLIKGTIPPVIPTTTSFRYVPVIKGPGDRDKNYDLTRIIVLHPGQPHEPLECSIKIRVLPLLDSVGMRKEVQIEGMGQDEIPMDGYVALSYAWENQQRTEEILIRHPEGPRSFWVTHNLKTALMALRHQSQTRNIWADALSMDQDNPTEKSQQLPLMSRIYSEADRVCVWLSDKKEDIFEGSNFTKILTADAFKLMRKIRQWKRFNTVVENDTTCEEWLAFMWLVTRPWFQRRWVVQEIVLATQAELRCGTESIDWAEFAQAVCFFEAMEKRVKNLFRMNPRYDHAHDQFGAFRQFSASRLVQVTAHIVNRRDDGRVVQRTESLESLISTLTPFQAGDPKDIVYAVLSLASDVNATAADVKVNRKLTISDLTEEQQERDDVDRLLVVLNRILFTGNNRFPVNYGKDFDEICHDLYVFAFLRSGSLDLILRPWCPKEDDGSAKGCPRKLPTWVRRKKDFAWHQDEEGNVERVNADPLVGLPGRSPYQASGRLRAEYRFERDEGPHGMNVLSVKGFQLDCVSDIKDPALAGVLPESWQVYKQPGGSQQNHATAQSPDEAANRVSTQFWRTMVAGKGPDGQNPPLSYPLLCQEVFNTGRTINLPAKAKSTTNTILQEFINRVLAVIWDRRLARTSKHGLLALLPKPTEPGDIICILYGCSVPVVLRRVPATTTGVEDLWEVVGECYVYDMMMGEALVVRQVESRHDPTFYEKRMFKIR